MTFDPEKTHTFFGLATPFVERLRKESPSSFVIPEDIAAVLSPLFKFGFWNLPGCVEGFKNEENFYLEAALTDAIFQRDDGTYFIDAGLARGGVTKLIMNGAGSFYEMLGFSEELQALAMKMRTEIKGVPAWTDLAKQVVEGLPSWLGSRSKYFDELFVAYLAPQVITAGRCFGNHSIHGPESFRDLEVILVGLLTARWGDAEPTQDPPRTSPPGWVAGGGVILDPNRNGNGNHGTHGPGPHPSIASLAGAYGETVIGSGFRLGHDPLREAFERTQLGKFQISGPGPRVEASQIVTDTLVLVGSLVEMGISGESALKAAVALLRRDHEKGDPL